jgi:hypothetical protein
MVTDTTQKPIDKEKDPEVIKTKYWELPVDSLDGWRPRTCIIDYNRLLLPVGNNHERGFNLMRDMMVGITGPRGAGKSNTNTFLAIKKMRMGKPCWSNVPISFFVREEDGGLTYYESMPLDVEKFSNFSPELRNGVVSIQELQYYVEARTSGRLQNRSMGYGIMQIRKTANSFFYDVQDQSWVDKRFGWSNDTDIECKDAAKLNIEIDGELPPGMFDEWGYLKEGAVSLWKIWDTSGISTGIPAKESHEPIGEFQFDSWWFWGASPTHFIVDAWAAYNSIKSKSDVKKQEREELRGTLEQVISKLLQQGNSEVPGIEIWEGYKAITGKDIDKNTAGSIIKEAGIPIKLKGDGTRYYNISVLLDEKIVEASTRA